MNTIRPQTVGLPYRLLALSLALVGGVLGIMGAFIQELMSDGGGLALAIVGAPIIEEILKPAGIYILLIRWPQAARSQVYIAVLTAISGLSFGLIESLIYTNLYFPEHGDAFVAYRFTVPILMHATTSFIVGLGINQKLLAWAQGRMPLPRATRRFFIAGMVAHAVFNITALILTVVGRLDFE